RLHLRRPQQVVVLTVRRGRAQVLKSLRNALIEAFLVEEELELRGDFEREAALLGCLDLRLKDGPGRDRDQALVLIEAIADDDRGGREPGGPSPGREIR